MAAYLIALHMGLHASNKGSEPESLLSVLESVQPVRLLLEKREDYDRQSEDREVSAVAGVVFRPMRGTRTFACCLSSGHVPCSGKHMRTPVDPPERSALRCAAIEAAQQGIRRRSPVLAFAERAFQERRC